MAKNKKTRIRTMADLIQASTRLVGKSHYLSIKAEYTGNGIRGERYESFVFQVYHEHFGHAGSCSTPQEAYNSFRLKVNEHRRAAAKAPPISESAALVPSAKPPAEG